MKKKRIVIFLIALNLILLSIFMINIKTYADEQISVSAETSSTMEQGSSAYCYVKISSLENVSSINISVYFDSDKIEVMNNYNQVSASLYDSSINDDNVNYSYIFDGNGEATETSLFYFYYKVKDDSALGNTYFDIIVTDALDSSLNELNVKGNRCNINVIEKKVSKTCYVYNNTNSINTKIGQEFEVKYYFSTYDIASGSMNITYDYDLFELKSYSFGHFFDEKIKDININLNGSVYISFLGTEQTYNTDIITLTFSPKKNITETSVISNSVTDLYDIDLNNIKCSSTDINVNLIKDESYIEDAPRMYLNASMQNNNSQCLLTIKLDENSNLGAGDFNITFDTNYLAYNSSTKILSATYFNVNDKKKDEGIIKFSIISLENISSETDVLTILFDINPICSDQLVDFGITASGLSDSLTDPIMLNMVGLNYELISNGHQYGDWTVTTEPTFDNTGLLTKVCQNNVEHTETYVLPKLNKDDYTYKVEANPTCTLTGKDNYTIIVDGQSFKFEVITEALGHTQGEAVKENNVNPTCEADGHYDSVVYCSVCGDELSRDTITVDKLGHNYGNVTYTWNGDKCTATRVCQNDNTHIETETVTGIYVKVSDATCTLNETGKYTVTFENEAFEAQESAVFEVTNTKTGHNYGEPEFVWTGYTAKAVFTCENNSNHIEEIAATITSEITTNPICEAAGVRTYTATVKFNEVTYTDTKEETLEALGHDYDFNIFEWAEDGKSAKAVYVCHNDETHIVKYDAEITSEVTTNPTCINKGKTTYTATYLGISDTKVVEDIAALGHTHGEAVKENNVNPTCEVDGHYDLVVYCSVCGEELSRDTITVNKLGHNYNYKFNWDNDLSGATLTLTCQNDNSHTFTIHLDSLKQVVSVATATEKGKNTYTVSYTYNGTVYEDSKDEIIPELGHIFTYGGITWNEDYTAYATFTCTTEEDHVETINAVVTLVTTNSTCVVDGLNQYTASVSFNGNNYSDIKNIILKANGHTLKEAVKENIVNATCETDGHYDSVVYCSVCNEEISRETIIVNRLGHDYGEVTYTWNGDKCTATRVCHNDNTHIETETVTGIYVKVSDATCTLNETGKYTVTFENEAFEAQESAVFEVTNTKTGHNYGEPEFVWTGYTAKAVFTCENNSNHIEEIAATITSEITTNPICEAAGVRTYTATVKFNEVTYTDTKEETLEALGHDYDFNIFEWAEDGKSAKAVYVCHNDETHIVKYDAEITSEVTTNPTCINKGKTTYTATYLGISDTKVVEDIAALGHTHGEAVKENNVNPTCEVDGHYDLVVYCSVCGEELSRDTITVNKLGHNYGEWTVTINPTLNITGLLTKVCQHNNTHVETHVLPMLNITDYTYKVESNPTCVLTGKDSYTIILDGQTFKFEVITSALGHIHNDAVKENDVPAICEADGHYDMVVYCSVCGAEISRTTHIVNKLGHNYGEVTYTWNDNKCTATRVCHNDTTHVETEIVTGTYVKVSDATCTLNETGKYTATFENVLFEAQESEVFEVMDTKLGHNYGEPEFVWDEYTAKAVFTCTNDENHKEEIQAVITNAITKESTINEAGIKLYTATVTFNNKTYTSTKEEILDKLDPIVELKKVIDSMSKTDSAEVLQAKLAKANQLYSLIENKESVQEEYNTLEEYQNYYESITNPNNDSKTNGLSGGAIAGIITGSVVLIAAIGVGGFFILKKKKSV